MLPAEGADLDVWVLGSSAGESTRVAGARGLPFAASYHTVPANVLDAVQAYRNAFHPGRLARPHVMVSADVVVTDTDARARALAAPYAQWVLDIRTGRGAHPYLTAEERAIVADRLDTQFAGSPSTVVDRQCRPGRPSSSTRTGLVTTL